MKDSAYQRSENAIKFVMNNKEKMFFKYKKKKTTNTKIKTVCITNAFGMCLIFIIKSKPELKTHKNYYDSVVKIAGWLWL